MHGNKDYIINFFVFSPLTFYITSKCLPVLLYGLEVCPLSKSDLQSLYFVVNCFLIELFKTSYIDIISERRKYLCFSLSGQLLERLQIKFLAKLNRHYHSVLSWQKGVSPVLQRRWKSRWQQGHCSPTLTTKVGRIATPQSKLGARAPVSTFPLFPASVKWDLITPFCHDRAAL